MAIWFFAQLPRSFMGATGLIGNHIIMEMDDSSYALFAHLRRGSLRVSPGETVTQDQVLARCGNSGNSTEPHLHIQLMDGPDVWWARGLPVFFEDYEVWNESEGWVTGVSGTPTRGQRLRTRYAGGAAPDSSA
jgi:murein DD-endopeptidase MepM/ murein hydrolase activator NlpD